MVIAKRSRHATLLAQAGLRLTRQRLAVAEHLLGRRGRHVSATTSRSFHESRLVEVPSIAIRIQDVPFAPEGYDLIGIDVVLRWKPSHQPMS